MLPDSNPRRKQIFSRAIVEPKRLGRTLPAIINGITASQAHNQGMIVEGSDVEYASDGNSESLFLDGDSDVEQRKSRSRSSSPLKGEVNSEPPQLNPAVNPFQPAPVFGQPSSKPNPFLPPTPSSQDIFNRQIATEAKPLAQEAPKFNPFQKPAATTSGSISTAANPFATKGAPAFNPLQKPEEAKSGGTPAYASPFAGKEASTFNFFPPNDASKATVWATDPPNPQVLQTDAIFDRPPSPQAGNTSQRQSSAKEKSETPFTWPQPALSANDLAPPAIDFNISKIKTNPSALFASQAEAPKLSFGTSPLFQQLSDTSKNVQSLTESQQLDITTSQKQESPFPFQSPRSSSLNIDLGTQKTINNPSSPAPLAQSNHSFTSSPISQQPLPSVPQTGTEASKSQNSLNPTESSISSSLQKTIGDSKSPFHLSSKPSTATLPSHKSDSTSAPRVFNAPSAPRSLTKPQRPDPRPKALDDLARSLIHEDGGLLQQFVEFTVAPIIKSSLVKFEDEKSWALASQSSWIELSPFKQQLIVRRRMSCHLIS